jgi:hypothetical protein
MLSPCSDLAAAQWVAAGNAHWCDLVTLGPMGSRRTRDCGSSPIQPMRVSPNTRVHARTAPCRMPPSPSSINLTPRWRRCCSMPAHPTRGTC